MSIYGCSMANSLLNLKYESILMHAAMGTIIKFANITYLMDQRVFRCIFVKTTNFIMYIMLHFT